jgi:hypothetical protein
MASGFATADHILNGKGKTRDVRKIVNPTVYTPDVECRAPISFRGYPVP